VHILFRSSWLKLLFIVSLTLVMFYSLAGCANQLTAPLHSVATKNVGSQNIKQVEIRYAPPIVFRDLTPKTPGSQRITIGDNVVPDIMNVIWILEDGRRFEQPIPLRRHIPFAGKFSGIEILFNGPSVEVYRAMRDPNNPLKDLKARIFP
jgi:hypothetical protein